MTDHPITPPPELVEEWANASARTYRENGTYAQHEFALATQAASWGANQELEACVEWLGEAPVVYNDNGDLHPGSYLRDARRPKPPSLKEQALKELKDWTDEKHGPGGEVFLCEGLNIAILRRALEQLDD